MTISPINHSPNENNPVWGSGTVTPKEFNIGDLQSDPAVRDEILALPNSKIGPARELIVQLGKAILDGDYSKAKDLLVTMNRTYGNNLEEANLAVLKAKLPPDIFDQVNPVGGGPAG